MGTHEANPMKFARFLGNSRIVVEDVPDPTPQEGEVLIELKASAICGSEMHAFRGPEERAGNNGHEAAGIVLDPNGSQTFRKGDRVGISAVYGCGQCKWCKHGMYTFCDHARGQNGMHAGLIASPERSLLKLPDAVPFDVGVLLSGDGFGVPYHVSRRLMPQPCEWVAVFGCGPIGLGNVLVQAYYGARVIAVDLKTRRLEIARGLGAARTVDASARDPVEAIVEITKGENAAKCIESSGTRAGFETAIQCLAKAGQMMVVSEIKEAQIDPGRHLLRHDATLMGSWFYFYREFPEMLALYRAGLPIQDLITHHFPLEDVQEAFDLFAAGETGKVILER